MNRSRRRTGRHEVCTEFAVRIRFTAMAESLSDLPRIPEDIRAAFREAVGLFCGWWGPAPEPLLTLDQKPITISAVCGIVAKFNDAMPEYLQQALCDLKGGNRDLGDQSYGSGARYLLELIAAHNAECGGADLPDLKVGAEVQSHP
jgi:hypothetical protein